ncbi:MAG: TrbG/VirB9 family P-type conjugative transfer protein [Parvularculaceae bacterium]|nr:TrbG/VirB9 family P-type conjugative transfer protein [Parvularculaceae bacterium]
MRALIACLLTALSAFAPAHADPRIREIVYAPDRVIKLTGHYGYQIAIEFPAPERIESVAVGDSLTWQVTPNKRGDVLVIKPVDEGDPTNMTVITTGQFYTFELTSTSREENTPASEITYLLRIKAPAAETTTQPASLRETALLPAALRNENYTYKGSKENLPSRVFDDGTSTVFEWPAGVQTPAIFHRRADGSESIVNYTNRDGAIVVHLVAAEFVLRNGKDVTYIYNDAFSTIDRGPDAPQPRRKKKGGPFGLFRE